ncbi:DUF2497 domain-containing protein [Sphingomonas sp. Root50]|nr:DUF2497 domain-containing protein [Sphingomonas sp. Root50]
MEDILASIKRIIHDDPVPPRPAGASIEPQPRAQVQPEAPRAPVAPPRAAAGDPPPPWPHRATDPTPPDSILELTDRVPETFQARTHAAAPQPSAPAAVFPPPPGPGPSPAPVQRAVERLRQAESDMPEPAQRPVPRDLLPRTPAPRATGGDVTLDALVREMLQPMLADWIDRNLPDMVERIVQAEIRRMTEKG